MKKLLQINSVVNTGSTGRIAEDLSDFVISKGWTSYIAYGRYGNNSNSELIKVGTKFSNYGHILLTRLFDRHGLGSYQATKKLITEINKIKPDIIHLHNIHGYYINISILFNFFKKSSIPVIWTLHDCWTFTGHCCYFDIAQCEKWKTECNKCPQKTIYPASILLDRSRKNFHFKNKLFNSPKNITLVPVSNWLNNLVKSSFLHSKSTQVIHNGIDLEKFKIKSTDRLIRKYNLNNTFIILGVANIWNDGKGYTDFLNLSNKLEEDERIILVGLNKKQLKLLPPNIIGIKRTESVEELCSFYSLADVFVNPTYQDSFGMVNIEALACGTPVITYKTGGSPETISKDTGFVVEQGNLEAMLQTIRKVKSLTKDYFTDACRERALQLFDKKLKYNEYFDLYNYLLTKNQN